MGYKKAQKTRKISIRNQYRIAMEEIAKAKKKGATYKALCPGGGLFYPEVAEKISKKGYRVTLLQDEVMALNIVDWGSDVKNGQVVYGKYERLKHHHYWEKIYQAEYEKA